LVVHYREVMATKKSVATLEDADLRGKKVLVRANLDVPLDSSQKITDDHRIRASVRTIKFLLEKRARVILASHLVKSPPWLPPKSGPPHTRAGREAAKDPKMQAHTSG
jgi:phosphoglycerate kinase